MEPTQPLRPDAPRSEPPHPDATRFKPPRPVAPRPDASVRSLRILLPLGLLSSLVTAALGVRWLLAPDAAALAASTAEPPLLDLVGPGPLYAAQVVVALLGAFAAAAGLRHPVGLRPAELHRQAELRRPVGLRRAAVPALVVVGALQVIVLGLGFASFMTLAATGYLIALSMPPLLLTIGVLLVVHGGRARWAVGVPLLVLLALGAALGAEAVVHLAAQLLPAVLAESGPILATAHFVAAGALWAGVCGTVLRGAGHLERLGAWTVRRRGMLTLLAACGPLPYALTRLTWLTPWPLLGGEAAEADLATRVWGLTLSLGAWLGVLLTIGLIRPWGEVFPRWFPVVGGRPVPVAFAAIPGYTVAALLCFAAVPMVLSASTLGFAPMLAFALIFPCWFWGPVLALAVRGYTGHRRSTIGPRAGATASARMGA